jgi:tRNA threonylcarbamoyl adenosine modification protein YeaZ
MQKVLFIDSSDEKVAKIGLFTEKSAKFHEFEADRMLSEKLLPEISKFLTKNSLKLQNLTKLAVITGPGGFSKVRTAVATANALAFSLMIPIIGVKAGAKIEPKVLLEASGIEQVEPFYDREPNITFPKLQKK